MQNERLSRCGQPPKVGMVHGAMQQLYEVYPSETAIFRGTLYPELDKPMHCAVSPSGSAQPSKSQMDGFAAWEARLYLNTHPGDSRALQFYQQLCRQQNQPLYACAFVPCSTNEWRWIDDPWPWEICAGERRV